MIVFKLEQIMARRGLTDKDLQRFGMNRVTLKGLLSGRNVRIDYPVLNKLCQILNCQPGDLLEYRP